jgi:NCAIR mutase (PurE)-related protein
MSPALGPQNSTPINYEAVANVAVQKLLKAAQASTAKKLSIPIEVETAAQTLVRQKLLQKGFSKVEFHSDQRDGSSVVLHGNPYSKQNVEEAAELMVQQINQRLRPFLGQKAVTLSIEVPDDLQFEIRRQFLAAGWKTVQFQSDQRDGKSMTLTS